MNNTLLNTLSLKRQWEDPAAKCMEPAKKQKKLSHEKIGSIVQNVSLDSRKSCNIHALEIEAKHLNQRAISTRFIKPSARSIVVLALAILDSDPDFSQRGSNNILQSCLKALSHQEFGKLLKILSQYDAKKIKVILFQTIYQPRDFIQPLTFRSTQQIIQFALTYCQKLMSAPRSCFKNIPSLSQHSELERRSILKNWEESLKTRLDLSREQEVMLTRYFMNCVGQEITLTRRPQFYEARSVIGLSSAIELFEAKEKKSGASNEITLPIEFEAFISSSLPNIFISSIIKKDFCSPLPESIKYHVVGKREVCVFEEGVMRLELDFLDAFTSQLTPKHWPEVPEEPVSSGHFPTLAELEALDDASDSTTPPRNLTEDEIFGDLDIIDLDF